MNSQNIHEDIRTLRTKKNLYEAFFRLLERQSFKSVTVNEICQEALIHRTTLYKHFKNKYELMEYGTQQVCAELVRQIQQYPLRERPIKSCDVVIDFVDSHRAVILHTVEENFAPTLLFILDKLGALTTQYHCRHWEEQGYPTLSSPVPHQMMGQFLAGGVTSFILWWLRQENPLDKETVKKYLHEIIQIQQPMRFPSSEAGA